MDCCADFRSASARGQKRMIRARRESGRGQFMARNESFRSVTNGKHHHDPWADCSEQVQVPHK